MQNYKLFLYFYNFELLNTIQPMIEKSLFPYMGGEFTNSD